MNIFSTVLNNPEVLELENKILTNEETMTMLTELKKERLEEIVLIDAEIEKLSKLDALDEEIAHIETKRKRLKGDCLDISTLTLPTPAPGEHIKLTVDDLTITSVKPKGNKTEMAKALAAAIKN